MRSIRNVTAVAFGVTASLLAASVVSDHSASAVDKKEPRAFYLTQTEHPGNQVLTACAPGFHMASLWEILDPSNLKYDTTLGYRTDDSGAGPPADGPNSVGWIRTGFSAGSDNCHAWSSASDMPNGWAAMLATTAEWQTAAGRTDPWRAFIFTCNGTHKVWCVED